MKNPVLKLAAWIESLRLRAMEATICNGAEMVVTLTGEDEAALKKIALNMRSQVIPPCLPSKAAVLQNAPHSKSLLFVGTLSWEPNADGLLWFARKIWPLVRAKHADALLEVVGKGLQPKQKKILENTPGVRLHGFVQDLSPHFERARVFVCPLRFGSGIKLKVLEALSRGLPVVSSPIGAEGFYLDGAPPFPVCRYPEEWLGQIDRLFCNEAAWQAQSEAQLGLVDDAFGEASRFDRFRSLLSSLTPFPHGRYED
jgi:glycosyltransferase involved in cell wall biosynthesis